MLKTIILQLFSIFFLYLLAAIDVWSVGIIFLCILTGRYPFFKAVDDNMAIMQLVSLFGSEAIRKTALKYGESFICSFDKRAVELRDLCTALRGNAIKSMQKSNSSSKLLQQPPHHHHSFCVEFPDTAYDLLKKLLDLDCDKRVSAETALKHPFFHAPDSV
jgi:cell division control protein 7